MLKQWTAKGSLKIWVDVELLSDSRGFLDEVSFFTFLVMKRKKAKLKIWSQEPSFVWVKWKSWVGKANQKLWFVIHLGKLSEQRNGWRDLLRIIFFCYINLIFILKTRKLQVIKSAVYFTLIRRWYKMFCEKV